MPEEEFFLYIRNRAIRVAAAVLCIMQVSGLPVHAGPVVISNVRQLLSSDGRVVSLRLGHETPEAISDSVYGILTEKANRRHSEKRHNVDIPDTTNSLFTGLAMVSTQQKTAVGVIAQDDVEGTICDCGEILIAGGGFPKWPFLFLGAIPLFFLLGSEEETTPTSIPFPTPTSTPISTPVPPTPVPEPATLLLFGSSLIGVAAVLRRRRKAGIFSGPQKAEVSKC